ncbi:hypothetical protein SBOR_8336 [Sclerotinia borealis F-4128]|uniref:Extensin domain-containing protein n=1 Tax=Sclerotinia borealis (strain F-4128) TaxID=1432307 RepID=W9C5X5_SCLBF|nr:hypothetical protein SBOR_8336 [Sclerotinia borealis F-4128]
MNLNHDRNHTMEGQDILTWRPQATSTSNMSATGDEDIIPGDVDEPPELQPKEFTKAAIRPPNDRTVSLLTRALKSPESEAQKPDIHITTDSMRRRSLISQASLASTAELTSDGGFTSPTRTNTPSPPFPNTSYYSMSRKPTYAPPTPVTSHEAADPIIAVHTETLNVSPKATPVVHLEAAPKKRCISFACDARKDPAPKAAVFAVAKPLELAAPIVEAPKRTSTIKFACPFKPTEKNVEKAVEKVEPTEKVFLSRIALALGTPPARKRISSRSPSITRKPRPTPLSAIRPHRESTGTIRRASQSPVALRCKPKYVIAGEKDLQSEAARFHEFCSEGFEEDDWIRKDEEVPKAKITINDTLAKEIKFRKLGSEAEEEALEDDEDDSEDGNDSDNDDGSDEEHDDEDDETDQVDSEEDSDGNETDNEAGFADSDDEDDTEGDFAFWTPGRFENARIPIPNAEVSTYRASANRTASASSIESLSDDMAPLRDMSRAKRKTKNTRSIKIRPGTPDLPDSTDFVCGTLDEDRPLEDAYLSCMTARKYAKHIATPQDIDPSFPTSDPEDEEDEVDDVPMTFESEEHVWMQGKFEDSDSERRRARSRRSPGHSPRRLHSPPPPKQRLRSPPPKQRLRSPPPPKKRLQSPPPPKKRLQSPPPRKLFGNESPRRLRSPPPTQAIHSPPASPSISGSKPIRFAPLGSRPGLTHTKSLPRTPNAFCRQYTANRLAAANEIAGRDDGDGPLRGAIDIVKGLERKRQRRKEKFYQKHCANRARRPQSERRPQPGKGAERMRELGLLMAGKAGTYMLSA